MADPEPQELLHPPQSPSLPPPPLPRTSKDESIPLPIAPTESLTKDNVVRTPSKGASCSSHAAVRREASPALSLASTVVTPPGRPAPSLPAGSQAESPRLARRLFNNGTVKKKLGDQTSVSARTKAQTAPSHGRQKATEVSSAPTATQLKRPGSMNKPAIAAPAGKIVTAGASVAKVGLSGAWQAQEEARQKSLAVAAAAEATAQEHARETAQLKQALDDLTAKHRVALLSLGEARETCANACRAQLKAHGYAAGAAAACTANGKARDAAEEAQAVLATKVEVLEATCASLQKHNTATHARLAQEQSGHADLRGLYLQEQRRNAHLTQAGRKQDEHVRLLKHVQAQKEKHISTLLKDQRRLQDMVKKLQEAAMVARRHRASQQQLQQPEAGSGGGGGGEAAPPKNRAGLKNASSVTVGSTAATALDLSLTSADDGAHDEAVASATASDIAVEVNTSATVSPSSNVTDGAGANVPNTPSSCPSPSEQAVDCSSLSSEKGSSLLEGAKTISPGTKSTCPEADALFASNIWPQPPPRAAGLGNANDNNALSSSSKSSSDPAPLATQLLVGQLRQAKQAAADALKQRDDALRDRDQAQARAQAFGVQLRNQKATQRRKDTSLSSAPVKTLS